MFSDPIPVSNEDLVVNVLTAIICIKFPLLVPAAPLLKPAVRKFVRAAGSISLDDIKVLLGDLGLPVSGATAVWDDLNEELEAEIEVDCPESGDSISLWEGDGDYTCPDCKQDIVVEDGEAWHAVQLECPVTDEPFWAGPYDDDELECPHCSCQVIMEDGEGTHTDPLAVDCPRSGGVVEVGNTDGTYRCTDCKKDITVSDGIAEHEPVSRRRSA